MEPSREIDLGLAVAGALLAPGVRRTHRELAAWAGCSLTMIYFIERDALKKIRNLLMRESNRELAEAFRDMLSGCGVAEPAGFSRVLINGSTGREKSR